MNYSLFIPRYIGLYYPLRTRFLGIDITKSAIYVTAVTARGNKRVIAGWYEEPILTGEEHVQERTSIALQTLTRRIKKYDVLVSSFPSTLVIFKELTLPFITADKISMVLPLELEPLLPFSLGQATFDFIITRVNTQQTTADVLVAAVQTVHMDEHLSLFKQAGLAPDQVLIDLFGIYGLVAQIPEYKEYDSCAVLDIGLYNARLLYFVQGRLVYIRTLPQGVLSITKQINETLQRNVQDVYNELLKFGLFSHETPVSQHARTAFERMKERIQFTLTSFAAQAGKEQLPATVLVIGEGIQVNGLISFLQQDAPYTFMLFDPDLIAHNPQITKQQGGIVIPQTHTISLGVALPFGPTREFNLAQYAFTRKYDRSFLFQLLIAMGLTAIIIAALIIAGWWQAHVLQAEMIKSEQEAMTALEERFPTIDLENVTDIEQMIDESRRVLNQEKATWFRFSPQARTAPLHILSELTDRIGIDKKETGLELNRITLTESSVVLRGKVRDFGALRILESDLKSGPEVFGFKQGYEEPDFSRNGIELVLLHRPKGTQ